MWQIPVEEINKLLDNEMDLLRLDDISRIDKVSHTKMREIMTVEDKPYITDTTEKEQLCW